MRMFQVLIKCSRTVILYIQKILPKCCINKKLIFLAKPCQEPDLNPTISVLKANKRFKTRT